MKIEFEIKNPLPAVKRQAKLLKIKAQAYPLAVINAAAVKTQEKCSEKFDKILASTPE